MIASGVLLASGLVATSMRASAVPTEAQAFASVLRGALRLDGPSLLALGLLVLMATPVARVAVLAAGWLWTGDRRFGAVALAPNGNPGLWSRIPEILTPSSSIAWSISAING